MFGSRRCCYLQVRLHVFFFIASASSDAVSLLVCKTMELMASSGLFIGHWNHTGKGVEGFFFFRLFVFKIPSFRGTKLMIEMI